MQIEKVLKLIQEVPDYKVFLTVDEMNETACNLANHYPQIVERFEIGKTRAGEKIYALKIGDGTKRALLFAMPHPNEPIGAMMLEFLSERLAADDDFRKEMDYTWYIIKSIDVDGTRLNEGWFKGPFSITQYARHYYRPPYSFQVEWSFPIEYKTLRFNQPPFETQALMKLIEAVKPDFMFSLHNAGFGGAYLYLSEELPGFYPDFYRLVANQGVVLHLGEPEVPFAKKFADAVFEMIGVKDNYDFISKSTGKDAATIIQGGANSYEYAKRFGDPVFMVCEVPYFHNASCKDTSTTQETRRDLILNNLVVMKERCEFLITCNKKAEKYLTLTSPFKEGVGKFIPFFKDYLATQEFWAKNDTSLVTPATAAEKFDIQLHTRLYYFFLNLGMALRMLEAQIEATGALEPLASVLAELKQAFDKEAAALESELDYKVIPIRNLVGVQLGCALLVASIAAQKAR